MYKEEERKQKQLKDALEATRQANNAKTDFLSRMSHDIRTPLNAIMGMVSIAEHKVSQKDRVLDCLAKINTASQYLLSLVNNILDFSTIEDDHIHLQSVPFNFTKFLQNITDIIQPQATTQGLHFSVASELSLTQEYMGDTVRLNQMLMNLLSNSLKFTSSGGEIHVLVRECARNQNTTTLSISVSDTGIGMSQGFLQRAFDPFEQEHADYARNQIGSGMGLPIVKKFATLMGGEVNLVSTPNVGTVVTLTLPLDIALHIPPPTQSPHTTLPTPENCKQAAKCFTRQRVLVVEDNAINQEIAKCLLEELGIEVDIVENGALAVNHMETVQEGYYALILMDIRMPIMDGLAATQAIRTLQKRNNQSTPIVAMTANVFKEDKNAALSAGMNAYLTKPIEPATLYQTIAPFLSNANSGHADYALP